MRLPEGFQEPEKEPEIDFDRRKKILEKLGSELMDMDKIAQDIYGLMPSTSSEMLYRIQLKTNLTIYSIFAFLGFLITSLVMLSLWR